MDYYSILGVNKTASEKDIKTAFRKLAAKHHPDKGGDHKKFIEIKEAYETLSDPEKRYQYDNPQPQSQNPFQGGMGAGWEDVFSQFGFNPWSNSRRPPPMARNADVRIRVTLELEEVFTGKHIAASYRLKKGNIQEVDLNIPPGVNNGDNIKYPNLGDNSLPGPRGDLIVQIHVKNKPGWTRSDNDLNQTIKINCLELILGTKKTIETLDGRTLELNIPQGTRNNTVFNISGYGIPDVRNGRKGNMMIKIEAEIPKILDVQSLNTIRNLVNNGNISV